MSDLYIILTAPQADALRGFTTPSSYLDPVPLVDGLAWVLPAAVLDDPAHAPRHAELAALPLREVAQGEWPALPAP